jgi:hypothetical protein
VGRPFSHWKTFLAYNGQEIIFEREVQLRNRTFAVNIFKSKLNQDRSYLCSYCITLVVIYELRTSMIIN